MSEVFEFPVGSLKAAKVFPSPCRTHMLRRCTRCLAVKPANLEHFKTSATGIIGITSQCLICLREISKKYHASPGGKARWAKYYAENTETLAAKAKVWRERNADAIKTRTAEYRKNNHEKLKECDREKKRKNPEVYRAIGRKYMKKVQYTTKMRLRNAIHARMVRVINGSKAGKTWQQITGYSYDELRDHLQKQFTKKMTWENYGTYWHIDHIIPLSDFDFDADYVEGIRTCWALSNLRPLCKIANMAKGAKRLYLV